MNFVTKEPINKGGSNENAAYHGPTDLYEKNGFVFCNRIEGCRIVRKKL